MFTHLAQFPYLVLLVVFGLSVLFMAFSMVPDRTRQQAEEALGLQGVDSGRVSFIITSFRPLFSLFLPLVRHLGFKAYREKVDRRFVTAGMTGGLSTDEFIAYKITMAIVFWSLFAGLFIRVIIGWQPPIILDPAILALGFFFPDAWLNGEVRKRQDSIRRSMPYVMDLLTLSVEAGLDFVAGLHKVCEKARQGPLIEELAFFLHEIQIGASRQQALRNLSFRCDMPEISSFSALLIQADILGASVGPVLRAQSDLIRTKRFQAAERKGALASQKLLFPLILCVMPAVFVVVFGPFLLNFVFGGGVVGG